MHAVHKGQLEVVKELLQAGADINQQDKVQRLVM